MFPHTQFQRRLVHKVRQSLPYVAWKERRAVARDRRAILIDMGLRRCTRQKRLSRRLRPPEIGNIRQSVRRGDEMGVG